VLYIIIRRAASQGYIPHTRQNYSWNIFNPKSVMKNLDRFNSRNDFWGIWTWSTGVLSLAMGLAISSSQQLHGWRNFLISVGLGVLSILVLWEVYLNGWNENQRKIDEKPMSFNSSRAVSIIVVQNQVSSENLDAQAARTATRLRRMRQGQIYNALLPKSLFHSSQFIVCSVCLSLESVSYALGTWIVRDAPVLYSEPKWQHWYFCVSR